ncbi:MAG: MmcQ/YjbR family DNA-binding protein, partial [Gemmatimonadota bacterium]
VRRLALALPGVEEGLSYGTPGFRVRGKFLARLWEDGETLVVKCGDDERDFRMQSDPETFYSTEHYRGYPTVLIRLASVKPSVLAEVLEQAWRRSAPKRLVAEFDRPG